MDIKVTFEDGSEAYLAHYGVAGRSGRKRTRFIDDEKPQTGASSGSSKSPKTIAKAIAGIAKRAKIEKKYGLKKHKLKLSSKAGLTTKYAAKVASANAQNKAIKQNRRARKLSGYSGLHTNG